MTAPLFSVALLSAGSRDVESLPSYVRRVACIHSVTVGAFLKWVYAWHGRQPNVNRPCAVGERSSPLSSSADKTSRVLRSS